MASSFSLSSSIITIALVSYFSFSPKWSLPDYSGPYRVESLFMQLLNLNFISVERKHWNLISLPLRLQIYLGDYSENMCSLPPNTVRSDVVSQIQILILLQENSWVIFFFLLHISRENTRNINLNSSELIQQRTHAYFRLLSKLQVCFLDKHVLMMLILYNPPANPIL